MNYPLDLTAYSAALTERYQQILILDVVGFRLT